MFSFAKTFAAAFATAFASVLASALIGASGASAATVALTDGGSYSFSPADSYYYIAPITGSHPAGWVNFTFTAPEGSQAKAVANYVVAGGGGITNGILGWSATSFVPVTLGTPAELTAHFSGLATTQTLLVSWDALSAGRGVGVLSVLVAPVPLPAAAVLLLGGLGGLGGLRRRRPAA